MTTNIAKGTVGLDVDKEGLKGSLGGLGSMFGDFGKTAGAVFAVGFGAVAAVGGVLLKIGGDLDAARDKIQITTGASGAALDALNADFANVAKNSVSSFGDVGAAIGGLNQKLGITGKPLEVLTDQVTTLSRITKTDLAGNITSITGDFNNWGVASGEQSTKLDELFRVSQKTGVSVGDLAGQMTTGGVAFRQAGLSFEESASLIGLLGKNGLSAATVIPALSKAMAVAAKEGKPASQVFQETFDAIKNAPNDTVAAGDALAVFGAKAGPKLAALIREGKISYEEFSASIAAGGTTILGTAAATDDWQEKLTKLGHGAAIAIAPLADKVFNSLGAAIGAVTPYIEKFVAWFSEEAPKAVAALGSFWNAHGAPVFATIKKIMGDVVDWVVAHWPQIQAVFEVVAGYVGDALAAIADALATAWDALKATFGWLMDNKEFLIGIAVAVGAGLLTMFAIWVAGAIQAAIATIAASLPIIAIGVAIAAVAGGVIYAYNHFKVFHDVVDAIGRFFRDVLLPAFQATFRWLVDNVPPIIQKIVDVIGAMVGFIQRHWDDITAIFNAAVAVVRGIIEGVVAVIEGIWQTFGDTIIGVVQGLWDAIVLIVTGVKDFLVGIFDLIKDLVTGKWSALWDDIKGIVNGVWEAIKGIITAAWTIIAGYFTAAWDALKAAWSAVWDAIKGALSAAWDGIKSAVSGGIDAVVGFVTGLPRRAVDALASLGGLLLQVGKDAMQAILDGIVAGWNWVSDYVMSLPRKFLDAFATIGSGLATLFTDAIHGLWGAIKAAWNWVADKLSFQMPSFTIPMPPGISDLHFGGGTINLLPHLALGGIVPGEGAVAAVVHGGEMVLNATQQAQLFAMANGTNTDVTAKGKLTQNLYMYGSQQTAADVGRELAWGYRIGVFH